MNIENQHIVLTGASGGIGSAIAKKLAAAGASLVLVGRNGTALTELAGALSGEGHRVITADLATVAGREQVAQAAGDVDVLINAAGSNLFGLLDDLGEEAIRGLLDINLVSPMLLTQALVPTLKRRGGTIVNVGSAFGSIGFPAYSAYCASKFGLRGFTEALRRELSGVVQVAYFAPRATKTAMNSSAVDAMNDAIGNQVDSPERVADEFLYFLRRGKSAHYVGWPEKFFVRLNSLIPGIPDRAIAKQLSIIKKFAGAVSTDN